MKYINKNLKNEPKLLRLYRDTTDKPTYGGYVDSYINHQGEKVQPLKLALLKEQGYICAYCMKRIDVSNTTVEHFESQVLNEKLGLDFKNMLAVCDGLSRYSENEKFHHCDKTKPPFGKMNGQVRLRRLDPRSKDCERLITYNAGGEILAINEEENIEHDLNVALNLNNKALLKARRIVIDNIKAKMIQEQPVGSWNVELFEKHLIAWVSSKNEPFKNYHMVGIWFLKKLMSMPKYKN